MELLVTDGADSLGTTVHWMVREHPADEVVLDALTSAAVRGSPDGPGMALPVPGDIAAVRAAAEDRTP